MIRLGYVTATLSSVLLIGGQSLRSCHADGSSGTPRRARRPGSMRFGHGPTPGYAAGRGPPAGTDRELPRRGRLPAERRAALEAVLALPGQTVCRTGAVVTVDGVDVGEARDRDRLGRPLPIWSGCRTLRPDEVFLMNPTVQDSLDGRYFGPFPVASIVARAVPIWTDEEGDGRFVWRAAVD